MTEENKEHLEEGYKEQKEGYRAKAQEQLGRISAALDSGHIHNSKYIARNLEDIADELEQQVDSEEQYAKEVSMRESEETRNTFRSTFIK